MNKYINADDYKELIEKEKAECYPLGDKFEDGCRTGLEIAVEVIDEMPSADVVEVKHGEWQITDAYPHNVYCSECHKRFAQTHWEVWQDGSLPRNFCPNCGADMRGEKEC